MGTRLYYAFSGSTLSSEAGFEGKMEELCRELGERGKGTAAASGLDSASELIEQLASGGDVRVTVLQDCLECTATAVLPSFGRQERVALSRRVNELQDSLDMTERAVWVMSEWSREHVQEMAENILAVQACAHGTCPDVDAIAAVGRLLANLDAVAAAHADCARALRSALQRGGEEAARALILVLEHGLEVLESLSASTPRRARKPVDLVCERVESEIATARERAVQLVSCGSEELSSICEGLCKIKSLKSASTTVESVDFVRCVLDKMNIVGGR
jgi:hypothetical protein